VEKLASFTLSKFDTTSARVTAAQEDLHGIKSMDGKPFPVTFDALLLLGQGQAKRYDESVPPARESKGARVLTLPLQSAMGLVWKPNMC
jgi:hypothetical protein